MKAIINNKLYDTETAEVVISRCDFVIYKTLKGAYFKHNLVTAEVTILTKEAVKRILGRLDPDEYIKRFGEVEEA